MCFFTPQLFLKFIRGWREVFENLPHDVAWKILGNTAEGVDPNENGSRFVSIPCLVVGGSSSYQNKNLMRVNIYTKKYIAPLDPPVCVLEG